MALLTCERCGLVVFMKRMAAKAHGWTSKLIHEQCEAWTCPRCAPHGGR